MKKGAAKEAPRLRRFRMIGNLSKPDAELHR